MRYRELSNEQQKVLDKLATRSSISQSYTRSGGSLEDTLNYHIYGKKTLPENTQLKLNEILKVLEANNFIKYGLYSYYEDHRNIPMLIIRRRKESESAFLTRVQNNVKRHERAEARIDEYEAERKLRAHSPIIRKEVNTNPDVNASRELLKVKGAQLRKDKAKISSLARVVTLLDAGYKRKVGYKKYQKLVAKQELEVKRLTNFQKLVRSQSKSLKVTEAEVDQFITSLDKQKAKLQKEIDKALAPVLAQLQALRNNPQYLKASTELQTLETRIESLQQELEQKRLEHRARRKGIKDELVPQLKGLVSNSAAMRL